MMTLDALIVALKELRDTYGGDTEVRTGGPEGDEIGDTWFDRDVGCVYIG